MLGQTDLEILSVSVARVRTSVCSVDENSAPGCCGENVLWVSVAQDSARRWGFYLRGAYRPSFALLSFLLYATFVFQNYHLPSIVPRPSSSSIALCPRPSSFVLVHRPSSLSIVHRPSSSSTSLPLSLGFP